MAKKRPPLPSWEEMSKGYENAAQRWLDTLLAEGTPQKDEAFEVADSGGPAMFPTTSSNPEKPRTLKAGYDYSTNTLTVVFRDGTWWDYRGVSPEMWAAFKAADSKGKFLRTSGLDSWGNMGPSDVDSMPKHRREQMNDIKEFADYMYGTKKSIPTLDEYLFGKG